MLKSVVMLTKKTKTNSLIISVTKLCLPDIFKNLKKFKISSIIYFYKNVN